MFEYSYLNHYYDLKRFKMFFIDKCPVMPKYEAYKIWAAWIIEQRSFYQSIDFFLPSLNQTPAPTVSVPSGLIEKPPDQLYQVLIEKGASHIQVAEFYQTIINEARLLIRAHYYLKLKYNPDVTSKIKPSVYHQQTNVVITCQSIKHTLKKTQYYKLSTHYNGPPDEFDNRIWRMLNNYYLLDGHSYQWAIPTRVLKTIRLYLNVKAELFASPINCQYSQYYSLFDEDRDFGSRGNFFRAPDQDFEEGVYQVNPPFIDRVFIETIKKILIWLKKAQQVEKGLMFIFFMPGWLDSSAYRLAKEAPAFQEIRLAENQHYYYSYTENKYIRVQFATHILVLSNFLARDWFSTNIKNNVINLFQNP